MKQMKLNADGRSMPSNHKVKTENSTIIREWRRRRCRRKMKRNRRQRREAEEGETREKE